MSQPFDFMTNGTGPDDSDSTNPFLNFAGDEPEEDHQQPEVQTPTNDVDFLSRLSVKNVFNRLSTKSNEPKKVRSKVWHSVVSVVLVEGRDLLPKADNTLPDPFVKFKLGTERCKSKSKPKTLAPRWLEQFLMYMYEDQPSVLEISVRDTETGREVVLGSTTIDLDTLEKDKTHTMEQCMDDDAGTLSLLVTVCSVIGEPRSPSAEQPHQLQHSLSTSSVSSSSSFSSIQGDQSSKAVASSSNRKAMAAKYKFLHSFRNIRDVGWLQVKVLKAHGLAGVDMGGKSDPFCVLELVNSRLQTQTIYKCLTPEWNRTFTFTIYDIHSVLEVTVYDENTDKKLDFLGKVAIPLIKIRPGERRWYQLKDARLAQRGKGVIQLDIDCAFNTLKAAIRTFNPKEVKYTTPDPKFRVSAWDWHCQNASTPNNIEGFYMTNSIYVIVMKRNIDRVSKIIQSAVETGKFVGSCFNWESKPRSLVAFAVFLLVTINFELYMLPATIAFIFVKNLLILNIVEGFKMDTSNDESVDIDCDDEEELEKAEKSKGFVEKLQSIQEVCLQVQQAMDQVATLAERIKNALTWKVPWLSWLALTVLTIATILLYFVPLRYIVLAWGVNKFTKKLRSPYAIDNNELLDYLSRVPSDKELGQYRELRPEAGVQAAIRKKQS